MKIVVVTRRENLPTFQFVENERNFIEGAISVPACPKYQEIKWRITLPDEWKDSKVLAF